MSPSSVILDVCVPSLLPCCRETACLPTLLVVETPQLTLGLPPLPFSPDSAVAPCPAVTRPPTHFHIARLLSPAPPATSASTTRSPSCSRSPRPRCRSSRSRRHSATPTAPTSRPTSSSCSRCSRASRPRLPVAGPTAGRASRRAPPRSASPARAPRSRSRARLTQPLTSCVCQLSRRMPRVCSLTPSSAGSAARPRRPLGHLGDAPAVRRRRVVRAQAPRARAGALVGRAHPRRPRKGARRVRHDHRARPACVSLVRLALPAPLQLLTNSFHRHLLTPRPCAVTNVATAHKLDPALFARAKRVLWMGAALDVPGNTTPCAEFNLFADPYAGQYLFSLPPTERVPIVVCPLDITTPHAVPFPVLMRDAQERGDSTLLDFVVAFLGRVRGIYADLGLGDAMEMHDPMCVAWPLRSLPLTFPFSTLTGDPRARTGSCGTRSASRTPTATPPTGSRRPGASSRSSGPASSRAGCASSTGGASLSRLVFSSLAAPASPPRAQLTLVRPLPVTVRALQRNRRDARRGPLQGGHHQGRGQAGRQRRRGRRGRGRRRGPRQDARD